MNDNNKTNYPTIFGLCGAIFAGLLSWEINKSILWLFLHSLFGWSYLIYRGLGYGGAQ